MAFNFRSFIFYYIWNYGASWFPTTIGIYLRQFVLRLFLKKHGKNTSTSTSIRMSYPHNIELGNNVRLGYNTSLGAKGGIKIGSDSMIGARTIIGTGSHQYLRKDMLIRKQPNNKNPIHIGKDVWVGAASLLISGSRKLTIGDGAVIGAGSRVIADVPPYTIVAGNPARIIGKRK